MSEQRIYIFKRLLERTVSYISSTALRAEKKSEILSRIGDHTSLSALNLYCDRLTLFTNVFLQNCDCNVFLLFLYYFSTSSMMTAPESLLSLNHWDSCLFSRIHEMHRLRVLR